MSRRQVRPAMAGLAMLQQEVNDLFQRLSILDRSDRLPGGEWSPPVDVLEQRDRLIVIVEVPGLSPDSLKVAFRDRALVLSGRPDEAVAVFQRSPDRFGYLGYLFAVTGRREDAEALAAAYPEFPIRQMIVYAGLGDIDRGLDALERAEKSNWWLVATWMRRPEAALLRGHPRALAVERRLGLLR